MPQCHLNVSEGKQRPNVEAANIVQQKLQNYKGTWKLDAVCHQTKQTEPRKYIEIYWNIQVLVLLFLKHFLVCPIWLPILYYLSFQSFNELKLGAGIDPVMALATFPSSIGWDSNPRPSNHELSLLTTRPDFCPIQVLL